MVLTTAGVGANVITACWHDNVFVPMGKAETAHNILMKMIA